MRIGGSSLLWQRYHNSIARTEFSERFLGNGGGWRHTWQYELVSAVSAEYGEVLEFYYPNGRPIFLQLQPDGSYAAPGGNPERARILPNGDCELSTSTGDELHFVRSGTYEGRPRYAATSLTNVLGRVFTLIRDAQGRLLEVRDSEGRWLRLTYRDLRLPGNPYKVVVNLKTTPIAGQWLEIDIPAELRAAAKGVHLRAAPGAVVAEAQFFEAGSATPLTGNLAGDYSAAALDGNPATSFKVGLTQRLIGYGFSSGKTVRLARVRLLAAPGAEAALRESKVVLELASIPEEILPVIAKVETSDGRAVAYDYEITLQDLGGQAVLTAARYGDGTMASYRYSTPADKVGGGALLVEADDPRYSGPAKRIKYSYYQPRTDGIPAGTIKAEINPATGREWAGLEFDPADPAKRTVRYSDDRFHQYRIVPDGSFRVAERKDSLGRSTRYEFSSGKWSRPAAVTEHDGNRVELTRDDRGRVLAAHDQKGRQHMVERDEKGRIKRQVDTFGRVSTTSRDTKGRVNRFAKPDGLALEIARDSNGRATGVKGRGRDVAMAYDELGRQTSVTDNVTKETTRYTYDAYGRRDASIDALGRTIRYEYNERGKKTAVISATGLRHSYRYDNYGRKIAETDPTGRTAEYAYDELSRVTRKMDFAGGVTTYAYAEFPDSCGSCTVSARPTRIEHPDGRVTFNLYDTEGRLLARTEASGSSAAATTLYTYDSQNSIVSITDPTGAIIRYTYDDEGHRLTATDPLGRVSKWTYSQQGKITSATAPDGGTTRTTYDEQDRASSVTDAEGNVTRYTYDDRGNVTSVTDAAGKTIRHNYEGKRRTATTYPDGKRQTWDYDAAGRAIKTVTADGLETRLTYDAGNRVLTQTQLATRSLLPATTTITYDNLGRRTSTTDPLGRTTRWTYDAHGNILAAIRPDGLQASSTYDARDRLLSVTDAAGGTTRYEYDGADNQTSLTDANGHTYRFTYDALHRRTAMVYPDGSQEKWTYDLAGRLASYVNRSGQVRTVARNAAGQPVSETWSANGQLSTLPFLPPATSYSYDAAGRLKAIDNGQVKLTYTYDGLGRIVSETTDLTALVSGLAPHLVSYGYDKLGQRVSLTYPGQTKLTYEYDARGRPVSIDDGPGRALAEYSYDAFGRPDKLTRDNGVATAYAYDVAGQLTDITHTKGRDVLAASHYALDVLGRRTAQTREDNITESYAYDPTGQLLSTDYGSRRTERFVYDPVGNRTAAADQTGAALLTTTYATNELNQYTRLEVRAASSAAAPFLPCVYDGNGNLINDGKQLYRYDTQNRLIAVESGSGTPSNVAVRAEFFYDARNRCALRKYYTKGSQNQWVLNTADSRALTYDTAWNLLAERKLNGNQAGEYIHGFRTDEILQWTGRDGAKLCPLADGLGSTVALANRQGRVTERFRFDAYGTPHVLSTDYRPLSTGSDYRFLFTGREWLSSVQLNDHRNRYYSPGMGRWLTVDPVRFFGGINFYGYSGNNPGSIIDLFGLCCEQEAAAAASAQEVLTNLRADLSALSRELEGNVNAYTQAATLLGLLPNGQYTVFQVFINIVKNIGGPSDDQTKEDLRLILEAAKKYKEEQAYTAAQDLVESSLDRLLQSQSRVVPLLNNIDFASNASQWADFALQLCRRMNP